MRFAIQSGELLWRSQFSINFLKIWHTCVKNFFLLTALLLEPNSLTRLHSIKKKKAKNSQKYCSYAIELFSTPVVSMVISPIIKIADEIKIGVVSKFYLVLHDIINFLASS